MGTSYAPAGLTDDKEIRTASSITDYIFRRLALDYLSFDDRLELGLADINDMPSDQTSLINDVSVNQEIDRKVIEISSQVLHEHQPSVAKDSTGPLCYNCGNQTQRAGSCYVCTSCGSTTGCS